MGTDLFTKRSCEMSDCGLFRYTLQIAWDESLPLVNFVGLNPSKADAYIDDPTINKERKYATSWGFGGLIKTNIFAYRSTNPSVLNDIQDPTGFWNNSWLITVAAAHNVGKVVCCWGNSLPKRFPERGSDVYKMISLVRPELYCLAVNADGSPHHPLYLKDSLAPIAYKPEERPVEVCRN